MGLEFFNTRPYGVLSFKTLLLPFFNQMCSKRYEGIAYHEGIWIVMSIGNQPSFTKSMALWNYNLGIKGKIPRYGISWKKLIAEQNRRNLRLTVPGLHMLDIFPVRLLEFGLGSFGALCKISDVYIFKRLLLPQFSHSFNQTIWKAY